MIRRYDRLSFSPGIPPDPACSPLAASCALGLWTHPALGLQPPCVDGARQCRPTRTPRIRNDVLRIWTQAGSPPSLGHRLDVAQTTHQTAEEERHE